MDTLRSWLIARDGDLALYLLDPTDRFGPYALVNFLADELIQPNLTTQEAIEWLMTSVCCDECDASAFLDVEYEKWIRSRLARS